MTDALELPFQYFGQLSAPWLGALLMGLILFDGLVGAFVDPTPLRYPLRFAVMLAELFALVEFSRRYIDRASDLTPVELLVAITLTLGAIWVYPSLVSFLERQIISFRIRTGGFHQYSIVAFTTLGTGESDHGRGVVRLSPDVMKQLKIRRSALVAIRGRNGNTIYRIARGTPPADDAEKAYPDEGAVGLELDDRVALDARGKNEHLKLWSAAPWSLLRYMMNHTDMLTRANFQLSLWVAGAGLLGGWALTGFSTGGLLSLFSS